MCFVIHPSCPKPRTAKKNIPVKKGFWERYDGLLTSVFYFNFYEFGEQPSVEFGIFKNVIMEGYHSVRNHSRAPGNMALKCYIPKGSQYYYNPEFKEYVSEGLIITEERL